MKIRNGVTPSMKIRKRDGRIVAFDDSKITDAIFAAAQAVGGADREMAVEITLCVLKCLKAENKEIVDVEHVQDIVEKVLIKKGHAKTAKSYILYRAKRTDIRNARSELMDTVAEILKETDRDNANISNSPSAKMLQIASAASREYYLNRVIPEEMAAAHKRGDIHIHDLDFYGKTLNCLNIPLGRLLHEALITGMATSARRNARVLRLRWLLLCCKATRMICLAASLSAFLIPIWPIL